MDEPSLIYYANGCCSVDELSRKVRQTLFPFHLSCILCL